MEELERIKSALMDSDYELYETLEDDFEAVEEKIKYLRGCLADHSGKCYCADWVSCGADDRGNKLKRCLDCEKVSYR